MKSILTVLTLVIVSTVLALPTNNFEIITGIENPNYIDIFANETAPSCTTNDFEDIPTNKNGLIDPSFRWRDFIVVVDPAYTDSERDAIRNAMGPLAQALPCVTFIIRYVPNKEVVLDEDYIQTTKGTNNGCSSAIGRRGGKQNMNLQSPGCLDQGTIMHEMIHALGFRHEQARSDRDDYVNIHMENVEPGREHNFDKVTDGYSLFGVPYNTRSIMHYHSYEFSANGQPTVTAKDGGTVGSEGILQNTDIQRLKNMYQC